MEIKVFTDGSCFDNGKSYSTAGYGIYFPNKEFSDVGRPLKYPPYTNQRAELYAIYRALKIILDEPKYTKIKLYTDSNYAIKCLTEWGSNWEKNNWINSKKKSVENQDILKPLYKLYNLNKQKIDLIHVNSHTGKKDFYSLGNAEADRLAIEGNKKSIKNKITVKWG
jgi:ribonuclease HI